MSEGQIMLSIEDRIEIETLFARFWWAFDRGDAAGCAATFLPDGVLAMREDHAGRDRIAALVDDVAAAPAGGQSNHHMSSLLIEASGPGEVVAQSYVIRVHRLPTRSRGNCQVLWSGYSQDRCVKVDGRWLFAQRALRAWEGDIPAPAATDMAGIAA